MFRHQLRSLGTRSKVASGKARSATAAGTGCSRGSRTGPSCRAVPTVYTVDLTSDTGTGSDNKGDLLYCITQANANTNTAGSEIEFDPSRLPGGHAAVDHPVRHIGSVGNGRAGGDRRPRRERPEDHRQRHRRGVDRSQERRDGHALGPDHLGRHDQPGRRRHRQRWHADGHELHVHQQHERAPHGGGIANDGTLTITNSTFVNNSAAFGGGIENEGTLTVTGSTIESNTATSFGGGIDNDDGGTATLTSTTLTSNSAS